MPDDLTPPLEGAYWDLPDGYDDSCHLDFPETAMPDCTYGDPDSATTVLLLGDSHAQQWLPAVQALAEERGWRLRAITKSACPLAEGTVWNSVLKRDYRECDQWREAAYELIEAEAPAFVLLAADSRYELMQDGQRLGGGHDQAWEAALTASYARVNELAPAIVIADTPRVGYDPAECLATSAAIEDCDVDRARMVDEAYAELETSAAANAGAGLVSATDWICFEADCPLVRGAMLVYRDSHHLTATFADRLSERLGVAIDAVRGVVR